MNAEAEAKQAEEQVQNCRTPPRARRRAGIRIDSTPPKSLWDDPKATAAFKIRLYNTSDQETVRIRTNYARRCSCQSPSGFDHGISRCKSSGSHSGAWGEVGCWTEGKQRGGRYSDARRSDDCDDCQAPARAQRCGREAETAQAITSIATEKHFVGFEYKVGFSAHR
jgi:hypothetical protein